MSNQTQERTKKLYVPRHDILEPNLLWENRFQIKSTSSDRLYIIAQNKAKRHCACSCPSYRTRRYCRHLKELGLGEKEESLNFKLQIIPV